eukprot:63179_1
MEIEIPYFRFHQDEVISNVFRWLNKFVLYLPMCTSKTPANHNLRSQNLTLLIIFIVSTCNLFHYSMVIWWILTTWSHEYFAQIAYAVQETAMLCSRYLSIFYYYKHFNYPWICDTTVIKINCKLKDYKTVVNALNKSNSIIKILYAIIIICHLITFIFYGIDDYLNGQYLWFVADIVAPVFVFLPVYTSFVVIAVIFTKYYAFLLHLMQIIKQSNTSNITQILDEYTMLRKSFVIDDNIYLRWSVLLWLFQFLLETWTSSVDIFDGNHSVFNKMAELITYITDFSFMFLFFYTSCIMSQAFQKFISLLYEYGNQFVQEKRLTHDHWTYNYMLQYVLKHELNVQVAGIAITRRNTVKFVITFIVARMLSYAVYYFY